MKFRIFVFSRITILGVKEYNKEIGKAVNSAAESGARKRTAINLTRPMHPRLVSQRLAKGDAAVTHRWFRHALANIAAAASHELINWCHGTSTNDLKIILKKCYYAMARGGRLSNVRWCAVGRLLNPET